MEFADKILSMSNVERSVFDILFQSKTALNASQVWANLVFRTSASILEKRTFDFAVDSAMKKGLPLPSLPAPRVKLEINYTPESANKFANAYGEKENSFSTIATRARFLAPLLTKYGLVKVPDHNTVKKILERLRVLELIQFVEVKNDKKTNGVYFLPSSTREMWNKNQEKFNL